MYRVVAVVLCATPLLAQAVRNPQQLLKQAVQEQQAGKLDAAVRDYRTLLASYPNIPLLRSNLGAALAAEGDYTGAIVEYEKALKSQDNPQVRMNLALAYYKSTDLASAIGELKTVHAAEPANLQAAMLLADSYLQLGKNREVVELLSPLESTQGNNDAFIYLLGTALIRDKQVDKGQRLVDKILRNGDSAEARLMLGTAKLMVSDFAGARDDFQKAVALNPNLPDVNAYYGEALLSTGDQANARLAFERELKSNPNDFEANLHLGVLLRHDQDYDGALKYLHHALVIRPGDPGVRYQLATIELERDQIPEAQRDLESLVKDQPDFIEAHVSLATVYFREKRKEDGNRERAIFAKLNAARQARNEIAAKPAQ